ncbi:EAL domain-containing protein [Marinococcus sp. PL1-022]|uniref:EAL domain-containing protein n=1 Tax=Marinococcus sp. PL1-022 TaxID=3095363 RepID=UPI0039B5919D
MSPGDFGPGYSSPGYIKDFSLDTLKIDKTFIKDMNGVSRETAIVVIVLHLSAQLDFHVITKGIEAPQQLNFLWQKKCHEYQGPLYSPPVTKNELFKMYKKNDNILY